MRHTAGSRPDDGALIRQFVNSFEYLFGDSDDDNNSDDSSEGVTKPLLSSAATSKKSCKSLVSTATNRPINSTFSYTTSDPTVFKPKLNFISTKDVFKVLVDGSTDFCASKSRYRSRLLQLPEMWDRFVEDKEKLVSAEYENMIYQVLEFRVLFEFLNGGAGGPPFAGIKKAYPTDEEKWARKETVILNMEAGGVPAGVEAEGEVRTGPKKTRKKRLLEKIASTLSEAPAALPVVDKEAEEPEVSTDEEEEREVVPKKLEPIVMAPVVMIDETTADDDEWIQVGAPKQITASRKASADIPVAPVARAEPLEKLSPALLTKPLGGWRMNDRHYWCSTLKAVRRRTFIEIVSLSDARAVRECPF